MLFIAEVEEGISFHESRGTRLSSYMTFSDTDIGDSEHNLFLNFYGTLIFVTFLVPTFFDVLYDSLLSFWQCFDSLTGASRKVFNKDTRIFIYFIGIKESLYFITITVTYLILLLLIRRVRLY